MSEKALLTPTPPTDEEDRIAGILSQVEQTLGFIPDGLRLYRISPPLLENFVANIGYFREHPSLRQELLAMIRYLGSSKAGGQFCVDLNESFLISMGVDRDIIRATRDNPENAPLEAKEMPLLRLALKALDEPGAVNKTDLDVARESGWSDRDIFDVVALAANNRAFNIVLKTFNIEHQGTLA
jgi:alkylhydroperoxidase family enzyme